MAADTFQKNSRGPSYTDLNLVEVQNKSLKRETKQFGDTENAEAIRGANKRRVTKESRHTGRK